MKPENMTVDYAIGVLRKLLDTNNKINKMEATRAIEMAVDAMDYKRCIDTARHAHGQDLGWW